MGRGGGEETLTDCEKVAAPPRHRPFVELPASTPDDLRIQRCILAGDRQAAEDLLRLHLDGLYEFVHYRVGGRRSVAEDVVQDTLVVALGKIASFEGESSFSTWLYGIAKNKIRSWRRKRRPVALEDLLEEVDPQIDAILADVSREPLPEWVLERQETQELVGATLSSLPRDYREALIDKYLNGLSVRELAARDGASPKAAESKLHRARLAFARVFELLAGKRGVDE